MSTDNPSVLKAESKTVLKLKVYSIAPINTKQKPERKQNRAK